MAKDDSGSAPAGGASTHTTEHRRRRLLHWASIATIGGFMFGFDTGVISGALLFIREDFDLNSFQQGAVVSVLLVGAMIGALIGGDVAGRIGRRKTLILVAAVFALSLLAAAVAVDFYSLLAARLVIGVAVGSGSAVVPVYLTEISPNRVRGRIVATYQLLITVGILVSYIVDLVFASTENWRMMFGVGIIPALIMFFGMFWLPETAPWLDRHGRRDEAIDVLDDVMDADEANKQLADYERTETGGDGASWKAMFSSPLVRPALLIGLTLAVLQQFGGINTIIYYAPSIMEETGLNASNSIFYSIIIGVLNTVMTLVAMPIVDRQGRKPLLIISLTGMMMALVPLGAVFMLYPDGGASVLTLICILVYIAAFAVGLGPIFWLLNSELYPPSVRAAAAGIGTMVNWLANAIVSQTFLPLSEALGQGWTFWIFAFVCLAGLLFVIKKVPETKGRGPGEVQAAITGRPVREAA